jgi:hypothetical protein
MVFSVLLNVANYLAWFAAFWLVLRFALPHAAGLALVLGLLTMLVVAPLLFDRLRPGDAPVKRIEPIKAPVVPTVPTDPGEEKGKADKK